MSDLDMPAIEFTVRDLNRQTAKVLETCDQEGTVRIQSRSGKSYELRACQPEPAPVSGNQAIREWVKMNRARRAALRIPKMTKEQSEMLDRLIAGE